MKTFFLASWFLIAAISASGQLSQIENDFQSKKASYSQEHFSEGEDATSGYDYLFYKYGNKIVKIRSVWSASHTKELRIEDLYFVGESLVLLQRMKGSKNQLATLKRGRNAPLTKKEELHFSNSQLTTWNENGKVIPKTDPRWVETERSTLEHAKAERESYDWLKDND